MTTAEAPQIALGPTDHPAFDYFAHAITRGGGRLTELSKAQALVWLSLPDDAPFPAPLPDGIRWVQLPSAGVERWFDRELIDTRAVWTSAAGAYAATVAEHAVALLLAGVRGLRRAYDATSWDPGRIAPRTGTLDGARVAIIGAGGIGRTMIPALRAFGADVLAVNHSGRAVPGASDVVTADEIDRVWPVADHVVIAAPATDATRHLVGAAELAQLKPHSWIVNIARGSLIDTDALVAALENESIGGAALDVTEPEPLPDQHPLWSLPNAIITPHVANPVQRMPAALADHIERNVARFAAGRPLLAEIDPKAGY